MIIDREALQKAKEKLGDEMAFIIANEFPDLDFDEKNLKMCCPYHDEDHASFIWNRKNLSFHCFGACGRSYDIIDVFMSKGYTYLEACQKVFELANMPYAFGEKGIKTRRQYRYPKEEPINDKKNIYKYFKNRKIPKEVVDYFDVREDENGNCVFNYYDTNDVLTMVKYRPSKKVKKGENKTWCQKDADTTPLLFNMNRINFDIPLLITEGECDAMAAYTSGYSNVVSIPLGAGNYHWIEENWDWLEQFDSIIICADNDEAGVKMQKECVFRLGSWRTKFVDIPPYHVDEEKQLNILMKDLNEVLYYEGKEKVLELILNAKDSPIDSVADYTDVKNIDLDELDCIKTGIKELDSQLMGLFQGTLTICTGINGSGKSTFISQLSCEAVEQDKNVFLYSGELPNFLAANWLNFAFAGQRNLNQFRDGDTVYWKVKPEAKKQIDDYYRGKIYIYKDGYDHNISTIMKSMEDCVRKYGTKLCIIDNLTALNLECSDDSKYQKQAEFITTLIDFSKKFNVACVLIVHPHKIDMVRKLNKMDVAGSSSIIDMAHRIISLYRVQNDDRVGVPKKNGQGWIKPPIHHDVILSVLKDRLRGYEGSDIGLYYDRPSRRFFTDEKHLDKQYSWDKNVYNTPLPFGAPQLVSDTEVFGEVVA